MPRIPDNLLECSIYLYSSRLEAADGLAARGGTGLIVSLPSKRIEGFQHPYFVTNQHVIAEGFPVVRAVSTDGRSRTWEFNTSDWEPHPDGDDLAACAVDLDSVPEQFRALQEELFVSPSVAIENNIGVGDDVFMVSRLLGYDGRERNEPILRFGHLALGKTTTIEQDSPRRGILQESYIVEMRSVCGCSGSPVFWLKHNEPKALGTMGINFVSRILLLGIDWGHLLDKSPVLAKSDNDSNTKTNLYAKVASAIATVVPAWKIKELLVNEFKDQREMRDDEEARRRAVTPPAVLDATAQSSDAFTQQDFETALKKASRHTKPSKSDEGKS